MHGKHVECLLAKPPEHDPPVTASVQASLSADHALKHLLVERQIGYDLLQFAILFIELMQSLSDGMRPPHFSREVIEAYHAVAVTDHRLAIDDAGSRPQPSDGFDN
jgi:hypothetical protein